MILFFLCNFLLTIHFIRPGLFEDLWTDLHGLEKWPFNGTVCTTVSKFFIICFNRIMAHPIFDIRGLGI